MELKTVGFDLIGEQDRKDFEKIFGEYSRKIERKLKNISSFILYLKDYSKEGKRNRYSLHLRAISPAGKTFEASAIDWDFKRTLHKIFTKMENLLEKEFHLSDQHQK
ncbi:hypothetical protein HYT24_03415 [Candidatus Pacearchaeota archaeon]|nr:hypothetical protein [Candidatus Pacearchaeota archaeon]